MTARLRRFHDSKDVLPESQYAESLSGLLATLVHEGEDYRPRGIDDVPGGIVYLKDDIPTVILPDLHARKGMVMRVLEYRGGHSRTVLERILAGELQLVCVGDYVHGEGRAAGRWRRAFNEFLDGFSTHAAMDEEMGESLAVVAMVCELKTAAPAYVHLLKGNHENITNEKGRGNFPFGKFVREGLMVVEYLRKFFSPELLQSLYGFEKLLPLLAVGSNFLVTHAEPAGHYSKQELLNYNRNPHVIVGLTWTANGKAEPDSVRRMLDEYLGPAAAGKAYHFGGHRPIPGVYNLRADGRYVQIHNPDRYIMAFLEPGRDIDLDTDIVDLGPAEEEGNGANS